MADTIANGFWLTIIDMTVVFLVLYIIALTIKAIKIVVAPLGNGPGGGGANRPETPEPESGDPVAVDAAGSDAVEGPEGLNAETTAVITAALAAYLEEPAFVPVVMDGQARRWESLWAMAGRTRVMQARDLAKRRATA
ncbi:MAG: OadG family protein [Ignavibacteriales bacterium]